MAANSRAVSYLMVQSSITTPLIGQSKRPHFASSFPPLRFANYLELIISLIKISLRIFVSIFEYFKDQEVFKKDTSGKTRNQKFVMIFCKEGESKKDK